MNDADKSISTCFSKYITFKGRADRSEFWWFFLFTTIMSLILDIWTSTQGLNRPESKETYESIASNIYLILLIPSISVGTRRLHDIGKSGWWQLISLTIIGLIPLLFWWTRKSLPNENKYHINEQ